MYTVWEATLLKTYSIINFSYTILTCSKKKVYYLICMNYFSLQKTGIIMNGKFNIMCLMILNKCNLFGIRVISKIHCNFSLLIV